MKYDISARVKQLRQKIEDHVNSTGGCSTYELAHVFNKNPSLIDSMCRGSNSLIRIGREEVEKNVYNNYWSTFDEMKFGDLGDYMTCKAIDKRSIRKINNRLERMGLQSIITNYEDLDLKEVSIRDVKRERRFQAQYR